jgi:nicotinamidase-related amidase
MLIEADRSLLLIIDPQERLLPAMAEPERLKSEWLALVAAARRLAVPVLCSEHCPDALGPAVPALRAALQEAEFIRKRTFSCLASECASQQLLSPTGRHVILCGVETHVCVMQTALDLLARGQQVFVVASAVASRRANDRTAALERMVRAGAETVTFEMVLFEWLRDADHPAFRDVLTIVKDHGRTCSAPPDAR